MNNLNPVTFRGQGLDGKERNLTLGRTWIASKQSRTVIPDGPHRLDPGDKLDKLCPIVMWDEGGSKPVGTIMLEEDALIEVLKASLKDQQTHSLNGPRERGGIVVNQFAIKRIVDKVVCRLCEVSKTQNIQEAFKDSLVLDLGHFTRGLAILFPKGELE